MPYSFRKGPLRKGGVSNINDPRSMVMAVSRAIRDAMDPAKAPGKVRQFSKEEIAELNAKLKK